MVVKLGSGSDACYDPVTPFGRYNSHEIELQQQAGLSSLEALRAATSSNAELLGLGRLLGSLDAGKLADLLVVDGDLTETVAPLMDPLNIEIVMTNGRNLHRMNDFRAV